MAWRLGLALSVAVAFALAVAGCSSKKRGADLGGERGALGEEGLGSAGSLEQARAGVLGSQAVAEGPLSDIHFAYDSFDLDDEARRTLQDHASWLRERPDARVEIEGHCDERGTIEYNLALGAKRAAATKSYLASLGVSAGRITTISYGEELPLCHEPTESCYQRNRRAHFVVIAE
jgi:peptidoglycan-associated lipoprotein